MTRGNTKGLCWRLIDERSFVLGMLIVLLTITSSQASAGPVLKLGDILVAEPGTSSISVVDPATGVKTLISQGGLLAPANKTVGVALGLDGDIIVVHRTVGVIRVNPLTGVQSILSQGGLLRDPWAIAINKNTGDIYVADSGYDNDRPEINEAGKIVRVDPASGAQELIATGNPCDFHPANAACQNTATAGAYLTHPYGIGIDYTTFPNTLVVGDMSAFNGQGAIIRIQPAPNGTQTLLWGPASALPQVTQLTPLGCPMGIAVEPNGNILTTVFSYPVPPSPTVPPPIGTFYGCAPPGIFRVDLANNVQSVLNANAPAWQANHTYETGDVIRAETPSTGAVHRVVTAGVSQNAEPAWNGTREGLTSDGSVVWQNIGPGANWFIPFGVDTEPAPTPTDPTRYNIIVGDEGYSMVFRLGRNGGFLAAPLVASTSNVTSISVITFTPQGGFKSEPGRSNGQPTGKLAFGTTQVTLSLTTDVNATCRYSSNAGVAYESMSNHFSTTGGTAHSTSVGGLTSGSQYRFYVRCVDGAGHPNTTDFAISFSIAGPPPPVAAYDFDEGSGVNVADATGNGNTGVISGASWDTGGRFGSALSFDGINDWVTINSAASLNLTTGMTLEAWVFPTALGSTWRNVLVKERTGGEVYNLYAHTSAGVPVTYVVQAATPNLPLDASGTVQLPLNTWTHLAATYDNTMLRLYVNGTLAGSRAIAGALLTSNGVLRIGGNSIWGEFFQGRLDEIRVYDRVLTAAELLADMNTPVDANSPDMASSNFSGTENPLSENDAWDSPGAWADLQKNNGAFATGLNAQGRLVSPTIAADQYSEITFNQDPDASSWVGVTTRVQGPTNGSGYLAIAHAGEVRLYRVDDSGALNFTILASASVDIGVAPRRLRLESRGDFHRVYFNETEVIAHQASGTIYSTGQPGVAASVFGGPQVKILSFESGDVGSVEPDAVTSTFVGTESPLSESGVWDSPGAWADLQKNAGVYAVGLNAQGRLTTPQIGADQYAEITYSQDPGSASWVGVTTRVQGPGDGSGYLAIAYAGEVRLYRVDDSGSLSFTLLASTTVDIGAAPRRLRMESQGNNHRVYLNGSQLINHNGGSAYATGQPGIAASVFGGPQVKILSFQGGNLGLPAADTAPPMRFNGLPAQTLPWSTAQTTLGLTTDENATCRYSLQPAIAYGSMTNTFTTTGAKMHSGIVSGLTSGTTYNFYVRCVDQVLNANTDDFVITFSVASFSAVTSTFVGTESPLSENGVWDSPGAWADLQKNAGAYAVGLNAQGRLTTPQIGADQYAEITYSQDPGSASWVGVTTRVQGPGDGSGYLAIAYAGEVRLYRADDSGSLSFTLLASATVDIGAAPRRLRMESQGNNHRVYLNGSQLINHNGGSAYATGQPGIAASAFGGPQVKILSFQGGDLGGN